MKKIIFISLLTILAIITLIYSLTKMLPFISKFVIEKIDFKIKEQLTTDDKVLTLSTCSNDGTKRVVIHAQMIKAEYR